MESRSLMVWAMLAVGCVAVTANAAGLPAAPRMESGAVVLASDDSRLPVSLACPRFSVEGAVPVGGDAASQLEGDLGAGKRVEASFAPLALVDSTQLEVRLLVQWSPAESVLRKWVRFRLSGGSPKVLQEIVLEDVDATARSVRMDAASVQSYPAFFDGFFVGIEFPVAATRVEGGRLLLASRPGLRMQPGTWYESRRAVYGIAARGGELRAFRRYISAHRPGPRGLHVNYNSWWTSPVPYTERDVLGLMQSFDEQLYRKHHVGFDTFCIDMGWSNAHSLWEIDPKLFPHAFTAIEQAAERMDCRLGLWISPSSCYPQALDNDWAAQQGYESLALPRADNQTQRFLCLSGLRYRQALQDRLVEMITGHGIRHVKLDGYLFECPEAGHGHEPGWLSSDAIADGMTQVCRACREAAPGVWLEATCFGWNASPWWLFHVNSVVGVFGDDAPYGRVPAPVYRESYTTARDFFNLQGAYWLAPPVAAQEVLGLVHQTHEPFMNDAVMTVLRGHAFLPVYVNPAFMSDARWQALADLLKWARANASWLEETEPLLPESWLNGNCPRFTNDAVMPREPYGYAHWRGERGLVALRNPWIVPQTFSLPLDVAAGSARLSAVSLYPEARLYGKGLRAGDRLRVPLAPYETVVLSIATGQPTAGLANAGAVLHGVEATVCKREIARVEFEEAEAPMAPDGTSLLGEASSGVALRLEADVIVTAPQAELLVLLEGGAESPSPVCHVVLNGQPLSLSSTGSDTGWAASGLSRPEHWLFLRAPLVSGRNDLRVELLAGNQAPRVSVWVWAHRAGASTGSGSAHPNGVGASRARSMGGQPGAPQGRNALPEPELLSLDAVPLLEPTDTGAADVPLERIPRPVERINGIYLDALEPISVSQGWGTLQRNRSVWEKPITMGGGRCLRGLGTHASSRIVFALDGRYRRFQSWAGADQATSPTITFEVWVDGAKRWESGLMRRDDAPKRVDLDVTGAKTLELVVGDGGNGITCDHADWGDARLLR